MTLGRAHMDMEAAVHLVAQEAGLRLVAKETAVHLAAPGAAAIHLVVEGPASLVVSLVGVVEDSQTGRARHLATGVEGHSRTGHVNRPATAPLACLSEAEKNLHSVVRVNGLLGHVEVIVAVVAVVAVVATLERAAVAQASATSEGHATELAVS